MAHNSLPLAIVGRLWLITPSPRQSFQPIRIKISAKAQCIDTILNKL